MTAPATCRACGKRVVWANVPGGRKQCLDLVPPTEGGFWTIERHGSARVAVAHPNSVPGGLVRHATVCTNPTRTGRAARLAEGTAA